MPSLDGWLGNDEQMAVLPAASRAALAWRRINDRPTTITIARGSGATKQTLSAQTVRVEWDNTARRMDSSLTTIAMAVVTVFGIKGHATEPDTDIRRADRFTISGATYEVIALMLPPGEVQAICHATGAS